ncbi:alpha-ketoglutaric semialdehyde dehydrogenase GucD [Bacillus sp. JJ1562]|uniref:alpha-ketoglutaric semialdehyde dehydrogenase GucD n=1 Tax=Bacillus sp. JJ1562 TaxID=3122960 RepID=UPI0030029239
MSTDVVTMIPIYKNYIYGSWVSSAKNKTVESVNPANINEIVGYVQQSSIEDLDNAVEAAKDALLSWKKLAGSTRGDYLYNVANLIESRVDDIAKTMTMEMGKTYPEARSETLRGVAILRYYAGEGLRKIGDVIPSSDADGLMFTTRAPLGVVGVITPWNFPVAIPIWKMAPALIYGNTVVFKPAQETAVTAAKIIECFHEAGFPDGVVNMVTGSGSVIGQGIVDHPNVNGVTFTGSDKVGKQVGLGAFKRGAKYQLELGGKNPAIVLDDADLHQAVEATISGGLRTTGQKCTATSRVIVQEGIYEEFKNELINKIKEIKIGDGLNEETWLGPCSSESQFRTVLSFIEKGVAEGASLIYGGKKAEGNNLEDGFFIVPTVFDNVTNDMTIAQEEIFGPVLALIKVKTAEEAIATANDSKFGLSASIFTKNIGNILPFINDIEAGLVRVNAESTGAEPQAPFGGMKQSSSHSREQGQAAIEFFTSIKTVFIKN